MAVDARPVQRASESPAPPVTTETERRLDEGKGRGETLPKGVQRAMEGRMGSDLSDVRIHRSSQDASLARRLDAEAFTTGQDIYFGEGKYAPESGEGQELLAHELTHAVQQKKSAASAGVARRTTVSQPGDRDELEADRVARQVMTDDKIDSPKPTASGLQRRAVSDSSPQGSESRAEESAGALESSTAETEFRSAASAPAKDAEGNIYKELRTGLGYRSYLLCPPRSPVFSSKEPFKPRVFPKNPNATYKMWIAHVEGITEYKKTKAEDLRAASSGGDFDMNYWFARVYYHTTENELDAITSGQYHYPINKLQQVSLFYRMYHDNLDRYLSGEGGKLEAHWQAAFAHAADISSSKPHAPSKQKVQKQLETQFGDNALMQPIIAFGVERSPISVNILSALLPSIEAHIRIDLPRTINQTYDTYYAGIPDVSLDDFKADYDWMNNIFERAFADLGQDIEAFLESTTQKGDLAKYDIVRDLAFEMLGALFDTENERELSYAKGIVLTFTRELVTTRDSELDKLARSFELLLRAVETTEGNAYSVAGKDYSGIDWFRVPREVPKHEAPRQGPQVSSIQRRALRSQDADGRETPLSRIERSEEPQPGPISFTRLPDEATVKGKDENHFQLRLPGLLLRVEPSGGTDVVVDLAPYSNRIPGLRLRFFEAEVSRGRVKGGKITAAVDVPFVQGDVCLEVDTEGTIGSGKGDLEVVIPQFAQGSLQWDYNAGSLDGTLTIGSEEIQVPSLPLKDSSLTITVSGLDFSISGHATTADTRPGLSEGRLTVAHDSKRGTFAIQIGATVDIPGLETSSFNIEKDEEGKWSGSGDVGVSFAGGSGSMHLEHEDFQLRTAEGTVAYGRGPLAGNLVIRLSPPADGEPGELAVSGEGDLAVQLAPWMTGTGHAVLHPDGNVDLEGALTFPDQVELFKERKFEKTLFQFDQEFPLWGITIPIVGSIGLIAEIHAKLGARTKFGPGVLRDIVVEGTYSTRGEKTPEAGGGAATGTGDPRSAPAPSFAISGEFFLPAGAELVIIVGGGVGLAALVAELTGGIDLAGTAGAYATLSVRPRFQYKDGKYSFKGVADLQAAAVATLGINAYAAAEVGIGWLSKEVWRKEWNLAAFTWDPGISLGMQASLDYTLGEPFEPNLEFQPVEIDPKALIKSAMPESGQPTPDKPRTEPPVVSVRLEPDPEAPATAEQVTKTPEAPQVAGRAGPPAKGVMTMGEGGSGAGRGKETGPGEAETEPAPFVPPRPTAAGKKPEERTSEEAWEVYSWDRFLDDLEKRTGRRIQRAPKKSSSGQPKKKEDDTKDLTEAWDKFHDKAQSPGFKEFQEHSEEYWDDHANEWKARRYFLVDGYRAPTWPIYVPLEKSGTQHLAIWKGDSVDKKGNPVPSKPKNWAMEWYRRLASAGQLNTEPKKTRGRVRDMWRDAAEKKKDRVLPDKDHDVDHIHELQLGGDNPDPNLQLLHYSDNRSSGAQFRHQIKSDKEIVGNPKLRYTEVTGQKEVREKRIKQVLETGGKKK